MQGRSDAILWAEQRSSGAQLSPSEAAFNMLNENGSSVTYPGLAFSGWVLMSSHFYPRAW